MSQPTSSPPSSASTEVADVEIKPQHDTTEYPSTKKVAVIMFGLFISNFLVALDRTIIATAIPKITDDFKSLGDVGWYASGYLLTMAGTQPTLARIYTFFDQKIMFLISIVIFEIGSAICGASTSSAVFIVGRAVAGMGSAGIFSGAIPIFVRILPLEKRPAWTALFGMVFGISSVVAPLMGGAFTDRVSWRWCFYINLPLGAITLVIITFILHLPKEKREQLTLREKLDRLDFLGFSLFFPTVVCLLLALQWGGVTYAWNSGRIIALLVLFVVLLSAFIAVQIWKQETATIPPRILKNRNVPCGMAFNTCVGGALFVFIYYTPIWFQAIKGASAVKSGIMNLPLILGLVISSIGAGVLTKKIGYYTQWMYASAVLLPIGAGLITLWHTSTTHSMWIGSQFLVGFGVGFGMQQPMVAMQTVLAKKDIATGISLLYVCQTLSGSIFTSIANTVFTNGLTKGLSTIPGLDVGAVTKLGATELRKFVSKAMLPAVLEVYNAALVDAFYVGVAISACAILGVMGMEWKNIKTSANSSQRSKDVESSSSKEVSAEDSKA